jgi:hypothetical protein
MERMEKQTAVDWLVNEHFGGIENCTPDFRNKIEKANEMFEKQIMDAYETSHISMMTSKQYYNETFKSE